MKKKVGKSIGLYILMTMFLALLTVAFLQYHVAERSSRINTQQNLELIQEKLNNNTKQIDLLIETLGQLHAWCVLRSGR